MHTVNIEEFFGANAGKVWQALNGNGALNVLEISKRAKIKSTDVISGLGWLAREGKIAIETKNKKHYYKLA